MRYRPAAAVLVAALIVTTAACADASSTASPERSIPSLTTSSTANKPAECEGIYTFAMTRNDENDPSAEAFFNLLTDPTKYSADQQISIRHAYYTKQEKAVRALAAHAADPQMRAALQAYADGWSEHAAVQTADGPDTVQPDWKPVMDLCPGLEHRISEDLTAQGR
jgi:hypothetical protein